MKNPSKIRIGLLTFFFLLLTFSWALALWGRINIGVPVFLTLSMAATSFSLLTGMRAKRL